MTDMKSIQVQRRENFLTLPAIVFLLACLLHFSSAHGKTVSRPLHVFVSIPPQVYFVSQIGGPGIIIDTLMAPGKNHDTFSPSPEQITALSSADVFFQIGMPFEKRIAEKIRDAQHHLKIVNTSKGISLRRIESHHNHRHMNHGHHETEGYDPHTWLDPMKVKQQAITIRDTLIALDPARTDQYTKNCRQFMVDLDTLHEEITHTLAPVKGRVMLVFHPAYGYFADAYGLKQLAVEVEGKAPKARDLAKLIQTAKANNLHVIFVQNEFDRHIADKLAQAIHGQTVILDPLNSDYAENLKSMATAILAALK